MNVILTLSEGTVRAGGSHRRLHRAARPHRSLATLGMTSDVSVITRIDDYPHFPLFILGLRSNHVRVVRA
jgi:hypothetical protein